MKMLIVDDHAVLRQGLAALLKDSGVAHEVLQAADRAEGLALLAAHDDLDAVLLDLKLPDSEGLSAITAFAQQSPSTPIIIVSASEDPADVRRALDLGALGYAPKSSPPETLVSAVQLVMSGGVYVPPLMLNAAPDMLGHHVETLTPRQREVLAAVAAGLSNKEIGLRFGLSEKTVKVHVGAIFRTLGVANRTQAATTARAAGLKLPSRSSAAGE
jgi:two-component system, NarL family, nitrate/nitrite response regulator NarL